MTAFMDRRIRPAPSGQAETRGSYTHPKVAEVASPFLSSISDAKYASLLERLLKADFGLLPDCARLATLTSNQPARDLRELAQA
jgi:hypothetical protein